MATSHVEPSAAGELVSYEQPQGGSVERGRASAALQIAQDPIALGDILARSGYFPTASDAAQAAVKVMAGAELGFGPISSMTSVHVIQDSQDRVTVQIGGNLIAAKVQRSGTHRYRVVQWTNEVCELAFFERDPATGAWEELTPRVVWTVQDAAKASLMNKFNWKAYPRKMLFWRAISDGADLHCPGLFGGLDVEARELAEDYAFPGAERQQPTTVVVGAPPRQLAPSVAGQALTGGAGAPAQQASGTSQRSVATLSAADRRKIVAAAQEVGIKDQEKLIRALMVYTTGEEHTERVAKQYLPGLLEAIADHEGTLSEMVDRARDPSADGHQEVRRILSAFLPDRLPDVTTPPPAADGDDVLPELGGDDQPPADDGDGGQGHLQV